MSDEKNVLKVEMSFPPNSHKSKTEVKEEKDEEKRVVTKVITGKVVQKKKSLSKKFMETFVGEDVKNVKTYIFNDVLIPTAKDTMIEIVDGIGDAIRGAIEVALLGERKSRSSSSRRGNGRTYVSYDRMSGRGDRREERRETTKVNSRHNFDDIILETRAEANEVLSNLVDLIVDYDAATVADLYGFVGISDNHVDRKWGWVDLSSASVSRVREGYVLNLPKPKFLE